MMAEITEFLIEQAKDWLLDCGCSEELLAGRTAGEIIAELDKQYMGGWSQFLTDIAPLEKWSDFGTGVPHQGKVLQVQKSNFGNTRTRIRYR